MAVTPIGLSSAREVVWAQTYQDEVGSIVEGAVVIYSAATNGLVKLPGAAAAPGVAGVVMNAGTSTSGGGDFLDVQKAGIACVLLVAAATVARGDLLIVANTSGHVKAWTNETACTIVGRSEVAKTAGAAAEMITCTLVMADK
jgi:hypothetical protein